MITTAPLPFSTVSRICELKTIYEEVAPQVNVPKYYPQLTVDSACWFIGWGEDTNNPNNQHFKHLMKVCLEYAQHANVAYLAPETEDVD